MPQRVAITGSSGLIGGALSASLRQRGDEVVHLVRREPRAPHEVRWDPSARRLDQAALDGVDAVVNLAGAGVGDRRWTTDYRAQILASRVDSTATVSRAIAEAGGGIRLVSGSAVGYYGDRGDEVLDETSDPARSFLAQVCVAWEAATRAAEEAGAPVAHIRTGIVLAPDGGAMTPILRLARLGLGGPMGSGKEFWPWITLRDQVRAVLHLVDHPEVTGAVNLTGPAPARQREIAAELGRALHRPALLPAPAPALRLVVGEFAGEILASARVLPRRLEASGFAFEHPDLGTAIDWLVGS
jgi:uncharacterized protein (TIGR01777 family)